MIDVRTSLDGTVASLKATGVVPIAITLNLVHRALLSAQLKGADEHDGIPEHLTDYGGLPVRIDPRPGGQSAVNGRRPGFGAAVSQLLVPLGTGLSEG